MKPERPWLLPYHQGLVYKTMNAKRDEKGNLKAVHLTFEQTLGVPQLAVVADMGYYWGTQIKECADAGITTYIPKASTSANTQQGLYGKELFTYDAGKDCYRCPAGQALPYRTSGVEQGRAIRYYRAAASVCRECAVEARRAQADSSLIAEPYGIELDSKRARKPVHGNTYFILSPERGEWGVDPDDSVNCRFR
ncbi:MAG: hypothetical protein WCS70_15005 [Verrucomicrobiota bacterium]